MRSPDTLVSVPITSGPAFARGVKYEVANAVQIPNLREWKFAGHMGDGSMRSSAAQVCAVNKSLMSVNKIAKAGRRVIFDDDGSLIEDKSSGERIWMNEHNGMYTLKVWVSKKDPTGAPVFSRPGA